VPQAGVNSAEWSLEAGAAELTADLAARLATSYPVDLVVTSHEPKAVGTGRTLAQGLGVRSVTAPDLEEHHRKRTALMDEAEWQRTLKRFFGSPHVLLFGQETGAEARRRFERGLRAVQAGNTGKRLAVVSHATVLTLLLAGPNGLAPYDLWRTFRMPEAVVVEPESLRILARLAPEGVY
jgi:broad specificity phosphatase PhoE